MKLRNKKTGKVVEWFNNTDGIFPNTLAELNDGWEDVPEEPEELERYSIDIFGNILPTNDVPNFSLWKLRQIGNTFEPKEEAEKAVEKLKAWKRLKDKGFRFEGWQDLEACDEKESLIAKRIVDGENIIGFTMDDYHDCIKDLNICFGGEE